MIQLLILMVSWLQLSISYSFCLIEQVGIPDLWHFVYKSKGTLQYTAPRITHPYTQDEDRKRFLICSVSRSSCSAMSVVFRLMGLYQYLHHRIHSSVRPLKILFHVGSKETVLGWVRKLIMEALLIESAFDAIVWSIDINDLWCYKWLGVKLLNFGGHHVT